MGRKSHTQELSVWVNGAHAARWRFPAKGNSELFYQPEWTQSKEGRPLSLTLPFSLDNAPVKGPAVENYFENLLPDSDAIRQRIREKFSTPTKGTFDLLAAIGRYCVGATQLLPPDEVPSDVKKINVTPVNDQQIEKLLIAAASSTSLRSLPNAEFRISIAGAQEKTALTKHNNEWCLPHGSTPTTHIFKLPLGLVGGMQADMTTSIENEWLCSRIVREFDIPIANTEIGRFGKHRALIVERFDRQLDLTSTYWLRLVQEDFCQATGIPSSRKYEADGGPGIAQIAKILRTSNNRDADLKTFLKAQVVFFFLAAGDGHAKNFSIRLLPEGRYQLTPLYDVISYYPIIGEGANKISNHDVKMAMAFRGKNKHYNHRDIQRRHIVETVKSSGYGESAEELIDEVSERVETAIKNVEKDIPSSFPENVASSIFEGLRKTAGRIASMARS